jgi:hypothetical protein
MRIAIQKCNHMLSQPLSTEKFNEWTMRKKNAEQVLFAFGEESESSETLDLSERNGTLFDFCKERAAEYRCAHG